MSVIYNFYICNDCGFTHDDEEVDCSECSGKSCVVIYQTETIEEAWEQSMGKIKKKEQLLMKPNGSCYRSNRKRRLRINCYKPYKKRCYIF